MPDFKKEAGFDPRYDAETKPRVYDALQRASEIFHQHLLGNQKALDYVLKRGFTEETIVKYQMGFAPPSREVLHQLQDEGFSLYEQVLAGIAKENDEATNHFSVFRERIILPVTINGRISGFCGRYIGLDPRIQKEMKYLNSRESPIYQKRRSFLGVEQAKQLLRNSSSLFVVEAALDAPLLVQEGFPAIATIGTAFSEEHAQFLSRYTDKRIVFIPQMEESRIGEIATARALPKTFGRMNSAVALLPREGKKVDCADMVQQRRIQELEQILKNPVDAFDFYIGIMLDGQDSKSPGVRTSLFKEIRWDMTHIPEEHWGNYAEALASRLGLKREDVEVPVFGRSLTQRISEDSERPSQPEPINGSVLFWQTRFLKQLYASAHQQGIIDLYRDRLNPEEFNGAARKAAALYLSKLAPGQQVFDTGNHLLRHAFLPALCQQISSTAEEEGISVSPKDVEKDFFDSFFRLDYQKVVNSPNSGDISHSYTMWQAARITDRTAKAISDGVSQERLVRVLRRHHQEIGEVR